MSGTQNSYLKNQRAKQKKQSRDAKLERKHEKKNKPPENIHDMSSIYRPVELGFLPEEQFVGPGNTNKALEGSGKSSDHSRFSSRNTRDSGKSTEGTVKQGENTKFVNRSTPEVTTNARKAGEPPRPVVRKIIKKD